MPTSRWIIPDLHGYSKTLQSLVENLIKPGRQDELYFLGDYIDRGPGSKGVIDYIRKLQQDGYKIIALKGNHEAVMTELWESETNAPSAWWHRLGNRKEKLWREMGGDATLKSFGVHRISDVPNEYIRWMNNLSWYAIIDGFVMVHAGLNFSRSDPFSDKQAMLWQRDYEIRPEKIGHRRLIHGHVPISLELINISVKTSALMFIDLDNGPYLTGRPGFGNLVALELNSMEMVVQNNLENNLDIST